MSVSREALVLDASNVDHTIHRQCHVIGYEFPESSTEDWCLVRVRIDQGAEHFEAIAAALEAGDLLRIRDWFLCLADDRLPRWASIPFTEPCLGFAFVAADEDGICLAVKLAHRLQPSFPIHQFELSSDEWNVVFELPRERIRAIVADVDAAVSEYPTRRVPHRHAP